MADGRWQMAQGKKDFIGKGGYQDGFGIITNFLILISIKS